MTSKAGLIEQLDRASTTWEELAAEAQGADPNRPGAIGEWTFGDLAGHLNGWRARSVARMEAAATGTEPPPAPWPTDLPEDEDAKVDAINDWLYAQHHDRPLDELLAESRDQWARLRAATEAIPEPDLLSPGRYAWLPDGPLSEVVLGAVEHFHDEHEADLRNWLARGA